ncbi:hypothetical protein JANAI62_18790 [Jannaschia pagri]|uniref:Glycosyltransferase, GT2 family n=1 Tax=Jannaschia pagri TaxID=2829797 RepID=A0ABQ4NLH0_9RHOB|nr:MULTISPECIES: glycosyltransferase [unclassified Jannaschia]GIT91422.1 hypothetical protein JANAI61_18800 [Jannaschia sp. AI_61]GIT95256.1 hypothetical protein JANAI62_18790 [Jannaschia sp. AI_62]
MAGILHRIAGLYGRYVLAHDLVSGRTGPLRNGAGKTLGAVETAERDSGRLRVAGKMHPGEPPVVRVTLAHGARSVSVDRPSGLAPDRPFRFDLALPHLPSGASEAEPHGPRIHWQDSAGDTAEMPLRFPGPLTVRAGHLAQFTRAVLRLIPAFWGWARTGDPRFRGAVKRGLGLDKAARFQPLDARVLPASAPPSLAAETAITIVLPVYNGFDLLDECLTRVIRHTDLPWHLILIEDGSSDDRVRPFLRDWTAAADGLETGHVTLLEPPENLGFIGAVNLGFEAAGIDEGQAPDHPTVLLNSDALVPDGWASRLVAPLVGPEADPAVASVTAMSNDAEITTAPSICMARDLMPGDADAIDRVARTLDPVFSQAEMPTGVGFCMALSPRFLARLPRLDAAFGRGYGEEVDWCQKARALGGRHIGLGNLFVEHRGGSSFGSEAKAMLIAQNGALISQRYPTYDLEVARFIASDPLTTPRLALALAWADTQAARADLGPVPVYLAHDLGGGADIWLQTRMATDRAQGLPSVVLRVGGPTRWQIEVHAGGQPGGLTGVTGAATDDLEAVVRLLAILSQKRLVYSCGVGDPDPYTLPDILLSLRQPGDQLEVLFHDWLPISPSYTLLDADDVYRGPIQRDHTDLAHRAKRPDGQEVSLPEWMAAWGRLLGAADKIRLFSEDGRKHLMAAWPDLAPGFTGTKLEVRGHPMPDLARLAIPNVANVTPPQPPVVGVIGNLNRHKGAAVVASLGRHIGIQDGPAGLIVLGQVDPDCTLPRRVSVHGGYRVDEIPDLVRRHGITHWLVPAIWPETFSYATHEALATGLPVIAFDIGAQGMAVSRAANGLCVPLNAEDPADQVRLALRP